MAMEYSDAIRYCVLFIFIFIHYIPSVSCNRLNTFAGKLGMYASAAGRISSLPGFREKENGTASASRLFPMTFLLVPAAAFYWPVLFPTHLAI